jgi:hypothetical protein
MGFIGDPIGVFILLTLNSTLAVKLDVTATLTVTLRYNVLLGSP